MGGKNHTHTAPPRQNPLDVFSHLLNVGEGSRKMTFHTAGGKSVSMYKLFGREVCQHVSQAFMNEWIPIDQVTLPLPVIWPWGKGHGLPWLFHPEHGTGSSFSQSSEGRSLQRCQRPDSKHDTDSTLTTNAGLAPAQGHSLGGTWFHLAMPLLTLTTPPPPHLPSGTTPGLSLPQSQGPTDPTISSKKRMFFHHPPHSFPTPGR